MSELLSAKQVIDLLKIDRTTLYRMLREGRIRGVKVGGNWRFQNTDVQELLAPAGDTEAPPSRDILPMHCVQPIQEVFSDIIQVAALTTDTDGVPLSNPSNSCSFCKLIQSSDKGKAACLASWKAIHFSHENETKFETCHAGLNYSGANIVMDGKIVAKLITGQFYISAPDKETEVNRIEQLARHLKINEEHLLAAAAEIVVLDNRIAQFLGIWHQKVAKSFATLGYERRELMNRLKSIAEMSSI